MNYFYEPVNLKQWNLFKKVNGIGYHETFLATKNMKKNDLILLYIGKQDKNVKSGVYAVALVVSEPYIYLENKDAYCYDKLSVDTEIIDINFNTPIIEEKIFKKYINQFRTRQIIDSKYYKDLRFLLYPNKINDKVSFLDVYSNRSYLSHVDILNNVFKKEYKGHQKATQYINDSTKIWFPKIEKNKNGEIKKNRSGWLNEYSEDCSKVITTPPIPKKIDWNDLIVLIFIMFNKHDYRFAGAFKLNYEESNENKHIYERIATKVKLIGNPVTEIEACVNKKKDIDIDDEIGITNTEDIIVIEKITPNYLPEEKLIRIEGKNQKYKRNIAKAKQAIILSDFNCEIDSNHQSFISKNGYKYMEAHHIIPISAQNDFNYSLDVAANIVSLCPICHRKLHHGKNIEFELELLLELRKEKLEKSGIKVNAEELLNYYK